MQVTVITPDKKVFEGEVESAKFPGSDGSFQVLKDHAALISTLGTGVLELRGSEGKTHSFTIDNGVVEVLNNHLTVLVESLLD